MSRTDQYLRGMASREVMLMTGRLVSRTQTTELRIGGVNQLLYVF